MNALHISGNDLTLEAVREVAVERRPVLLAPDARERVNAAREVVDTLVAENQVSYAITTGVGKLSDVRIAGVKVGSVVSESLDPKTFLATVRMNINPAYKLPEDTVAEIVSNGLLGDQYMSLVPGGDEKTIPPGGQIKFTQSPVSLENLIGQMIFSAPGAQKKPGEGEAPPK